MAKMFDKQAAKDRGPVECLGKTFPDDNARREHYLAILAEKLKDTEFRKIEGFPIGTDEDILALSDPPYHTACPNPFLADFIKHYGKPYDPNVPYSRKPFAVDVSEGKTDPIYKAHSYHTKVPHLAIVPSILHYTEPGDLVLDGFCGSGMTGVAAQWCGKAPPEYRRRVEAQFQEEGIPAPAWGARKAVLNDLAPAATFIAANYNLPFDVEQFARAGKDILEEVERELGWMYSTIHPPKKGLGEFSNDLFEVLLGRRSCPADIKIGRIEYTVWSEVFTCPECAGDIEFLEEALDEESKRVKDSFPCPHCNANLDKKRLEKSYEARLDRTLGRTIHTPKRRPSVIVYNVDGGRHQKKPDQYDLALLTHIDKLDLPPEVPAVEIPGMHMTHERARMDRQGVTHVHHFFLPRAAFAMGALWRYADKSEDVRVRHMLIFFVEQALWTASVLNRFRPTGYSQVNQYMTGVYYVASQHSECSPWYMLRGKLDRLTSTFAGGLAIERSAIATTSTTANLGIPEDSVDYIFTDPPFGENIYYADLNFLVESWHRVVTNAVPEAIVDKFKHKGLHEYHRLMQRCFEEYYRVLKPGRWMTVVFHNSRNAVWNAIQEGMQAAGFVVADVRTLDKQQGSYRQVTSTAVKQDLVISAYKPNGGLEERFALAEGKEDGVWDFVRTHLRQLPVFVSKDGKAEVIAERYAHMLFDRMVAFHVLRGVAVPLAAGEFFKGLAQRFAERDGMYFLPEQAVEFDRKRLTVKEVLQLQLLVTDESSAIQWLRQQLIKKPQTFQELHPQFMKEIAGWSKHERPLELADLLGQNFLPYDGRAEVPSQIHSYLSSNFRELRNLSKDSSGLRAKAKDRWYVPDPSKSGDLEKLRERALLKEFWDYLPAGYKVAKPESREGFIPGLEPKAASIPRGKKMRVIRLEAVRAGFKHCWQSRDYRTIIAVAQRIPESVLQEDPKLLMWYDQALTRAGVEP